MLRSVQSLLVVLCLVVCAMVCWPGQHLFAAEQGESGSADGATVFLAGAKSGDPVAVVLDYIETNVESLGLLPEDLAEVDVNHYLSAHNRVTHVQVQQMRNGIKVEGATILANVAGDGSLVNLHNTFVRDLGSSIVSDRGAELTAIEAVEAAAVHLGLTVNDRLRVVEDGRGPDRATLISSGGISLSDIPAKLVYQSRTKEGVRPAWDLVIEEVNQKHWWNVRVDLNSGAVLEAHDYVVHEAFVEQTHTEDVVVRPTESVVGTGESVLWQPKVMGVADGYEVFELPRESAQHNPSGPAGPPNEGRSIQIAPWTAASPFGWHDTDGAAGPEFTITRGNNVHAYEDMTGSNSGTSPECGPSLTCVFPLDFTQPPATSVDASIANLFYWNNIIHDVWYEYGFDEAAGNFQVNNYGNGGLGNDDVQAEGLDGIGNCNANFATPPDGSRPRMQMFLCNNTSPARDGDYDNAVIIHEYAHGISNRLTGGPGAAGCLGNTEQMGEGWSDWFALIMTMEPGDVGPDPRGIGTYLFGQPANGPGIRPAPYSTDFGVNAATYDTIKTGGIPHDLGWVWATMLWDMTWALIDNGVSHSGFDPDLYSGTGGNNLAMQLVLDGMKLQPCSPGFVDGRDAILLADQLNNGGANQCLIWGAFAQRGLGFSAVQGSSSSHLDGTEAFDMPPVCFADVVVDKSSVQTGVPSGGVVDYNLVITNVQATPQTNVVVTDTIPAELTYVDGSATCGGSLVGPDLVFNLGTMAGNEVVSCAFQATVNATPVFSFSDDMENGDGSWSISGDAATWLIVDTDSHSPSHSFFAEDPATVSDQYLEMAADVVLPAGQLLSFWHHFDTEPNFDGGVLEISAGGGPWTDLGPMMVSGGYNSTISTGFSSPIGGRQAWSGDSQGFVNVVVDLSSFVGQAVRIRFRMATDVSVTGVGWWVDDVLIGESAEVVNTACADSDANNLFCDSATTAIVPQTADLSITKQASVDTVSAGTALTYTITVTNSGPSVAQNVVVTDVLPAGLSFVSTSGCSEDPVGVPSCSLGDLAVGETVAYSIETLVEPLFLGPISNTANVSSATWEAVVGDETASADTTVVAGVDLLVTAIDAPDPVNPGDTITYEISVANNGPSDDPAMVTLISILAPETTFVSANGSGWNCSEAGGTVACTRLGLLVGPAPPISIAAAVDAGASGVLTNGAHVSSPTGDTDLSNNSASSQTTVTAQTDLSISQTGSADPITAGLSLSFTLTVTNNGPSDAIDVVVTETLPAGVTLDSTSGCFEDPNGVANCSLGTIVAGASKQAVITVDVEPETIGPITNNATVAAATNDPDLGNNTTALTTDVESFVALGLSKVGNNDPATAGENLTYSFVMNNSGPSQAVNISFFDVLPDETSFVNDTLGTCAQPGDLVGFRTAMNGGEEVPPVATAAAGNAAMVLDLADDTLAFAIHVADLTGAVAAHLHLAPAGANGGVVHTLYEGVPTLEAGSSITGKLQLLPAERDALLADPASFYLNVHTTAFPGGEIRGQMALAAQSPMRCTVAELAPAGEQLFDIEVLISESAADGAEIHNLAFVMSETAAIDAVALPAGELSGATAAESTTLNTTADLSLALVDVPNPIVAGTSLDYSVDVANAGPSSADAVSVSHVLPAGVGFVSAGGPGWSCGEAGGVVTCTRPNLSVGSGDPIAVVADIGAGMTGPLGSNASVSSVTDDPDLGNNSAATVTPVVLAADLMISMTDSSDPVVAGENFDVVVTVHNLGPSDVPDSQVTSALAGGDAAITGTAGCLEDPAGSPLCSLGAIAAGASKSFTISAAVQPSTRGTLVTSASVTSSVTETNPGDESATEDTTVVAEVDLSVTKTATTDPVVAGAELGYTLVVSNAGPSNDLGTVTLVDTLPAGVTYQSAAGNGWTCNEAGGVVTCTRAGLDIGSAPAVSLIVGVDPETAGALVNTAIVSTSTTDTDPSNNSASAESTVVAHSDLEITKIATPYTAVAGSDMVYSIGVANIGPSENPGPITVVDTLPDGVAFVEWEGAGWTCVEAANVVTCERPGLPVGNGPGIAIFVAIDPDATGVLTNVATVSSPTFDPRESNNTVTGEVILTSEADLSILKNDLADPVIGGEDVEYVISVSNLGPSLATNVVVTDNLPAGMTLVSTTGCIEDPTAGPTCTLGSIAPGETISYGLVAAVDGVDSPMITNTASVSGSELDPNPANNTDSAETSLDGEAPRVEAVDSLASTGDGSLESCETVVVDISEVLVTFSEEVQDLPGHADPHDVTNPANFQIISAGPDLELDSEMCGVILGDDIVAPIAGVSYDPVGSVATVTLESPLESSQFRLLVCGSTTIYDLAGNPLDGDGNGSGGDDFALDFRADPDNLFTNGHIDCGLAAWELDHLNVDEIGFSADDVYGASGSGSIGIMNLGVNTWFAVSQCVETDGASSLNLGGMVRATATDGAAVNLRRTCIAFADSSCLAGPATVLDETVELDLAGAWSPFADRFSPEAGTASVRCTIGLENPDGTELDANLDMLLLSSPGGVFVDGFESGSTGEWTVTVE